MSIHLIYGDEPYLIKRAVDKLLPRDGAARYQEFSSETVTRLSSLSLFGDNSVLVTVDSLKALDQKCFLSYIDNPRDGALLVIRVRDVDKRLSLFTKLRKSPSVAIREIGKADNNTMKKFIQSIAIRQGSSITSSDAQKIMELSAYQYDPHVTMYTIGNMLTNLIDGMEVIGPITAEDIERTFQRKDTVNKFGIAALLEKQDRGQLYQLAPSLQEENGAIPFLMLLMRELRIAYKSRLFSLEEIGVKSVNFKSWSNNQLIQGMTIVGDIVYKLKLSEIQENIAIPYCFSELLNMAF